MELVTARPARIALPALIFLVPFVAFLSPHGLVPVAVAAASALATDRTVRMRFAGLSRTGLAYAFFCLLTWAAVASAWAPHPAGSILLVAQVAGVMAAGGMLVAGVQVADDETRSRAAVALCFAAPAFLLLGLAELLDGGVLIRALRGWPADFTYNLVAYDRAAAILAITAWPAALILWRRRRPGAAVLFLLLALAVLFELDMAAARLAFMAGAAVFAISCWVPQTARRALMAIMLAGILAVPPILAATGTGTELPAVAQELPHASSLKHRLLIAQFVLGKIGQHPLRGYGFDSSRDLPGGDAPAMAGQSVLPLHPHNGILQVWLELGLPGAIIAAAIAMLVLRGMPAFEPRGPAAAANATFAAFTTIALASYGIWQNWWLMTGWLAAMLAMLAASSRPASA
jgi:O-antigen ligase